MAKYLFLYHGGSKPEPEEFPVVMHAWMSWLQGIGAAVVDGGNPVGPSSTVSSDGSVAENGGSNPAGGYSLVQAESREAALEMAKGCPILAAGGTVEVAETIVLPCS
ncbi:MAG: hypothetical protein ACI8W8_004642 [Rhodothermales bacterium]|jgi:hypothetical protein